MGAGKVLAIGGGIIALGAGGYKVVDLMTPKNLEHKLVWAGYDPLETDPELYDLPGWRELINKYLDTNPPKPVIAGLTKIEDKEVTVQKHKENINKFQSYCQSLFITPIPGKDATQSEKSDWDLKMQEAKDWCTFEATGLENGGTVTRSISVERTVES